MIPHPSPGHIFRKEELNLKRYMHSNVHQFSFNDHSVATEEYFNWSFDIRDLQEKLNWIENASKII